VIVHTAAVSNFGGVACRTRPSPSPFHAARCTCQLTSCKRPLTGMPYISPSFCLQAGMAAATPHHHSRRAFGTGTNCRKRQLRPSYVQSRLTFRTLPRSPSAYLSWPTPFTSSQPGLLRSPVRSERGRGLSGSCTGNVATGECLEDLRCE
jgi:hypothetical protein